MLRAPAGCQNNSPQRREGLFQKGIIDISAIVAAIERAAIRYVERCIASKTERQVRIREEQLSERNEVRASVGDRLRRTAVVVIAVDDVPTVPQTTQTTDVESGSGFRCGILFDDVQVGEAKAGEFGH